MAKIVSIAHANPERCLTQEESWSELNRLRELSPLEKKYYKKFMLNEGIKKRHLALKNLEDIFCTDQDQIIKRYNEEAPILSANSAIKALEKAKLPRDKIDCVVTASCTGYLCPGLSSYMIERTGIKPEASVFDLQGMGCGAALPALSAGIGFLSTRKGPSNALVTCTELCSSSIYWDNDLGLILSNSIFADGSASVILNNDPKAAGIEVIDVSTINFPDKREALRFKIKNGKLHNVLTAAVPEIASKGVEIVVADLLKKNSLQRSAIAFWAIHSGGSKVLSTIAGKLGLSKKEISFSEEVLVDFGNMSSPSVLFTLEKIFDSGLYGSGDYGIMLSFGAGFSCYGMLLKIEN
ncbi:MAG: type III polyketide synthase [Candidatus Margulisiibacteriota bacterium]